MTMAHTMIRRYSDLSRLDTFEERYKYLRLGGEVGAFTFGNDRHINQRFYSSIEWKRVRDHVILRDNGCDLGILGYEIYSDLYVHHMQPIGLDDIIHSEEWIVDPEFLITTTLETHNAIHYGADVPQSMVVLERFPNDTKLW